MLRAKGKAWFFSSETAGLSRSPAFLLFQPKVWISEGGECPKKGNPKRWELRVAEVSARSEFY